MVGCDAPFILWLDCECHLLRMGAALLHSCSCSEEVKPHSGCHTLFENQIHVSLVGCGRVGDQSEARMRRNNGGCVCNTSMELMELKRIWICGIEDCIAIILVMAVAQESGIVGGCGQDW